MSKKEDKEPKKIGRPKVPIDWSNVAKYIQSGCLGTEVAAFLGIDKNTLYDRCLSENEITYSTFSANNRSKGNANLRIKQYNLAMEGDNKMLVWLGKQRLKQSDKKEVKKTVTKTSIQIEILDSGLLPDLNE
jgi:hypothetical protein